MDITQYILSKTNRLVLAPEVTPAAEHYSMFNTGGVEVETAELLYSLVRLFKPRIIVETGTHLGVSSLYMALGAQRNNLGHVVTYEVIPSLLEQAKLLWNDLGVQDSIDARLESSVTGSMPVRFKNKIDLLLLDSEPQFRFDEFLRFWDDVADGGLILVHDLHSSMGHHGQTHHDTYDWPYGYWKDKLEGYVTQHKVQTMHFPAPRGLTVFQKTIPSWEVVQCLTA